MTIGDETYSPSDLYLDEKAVVTLPMMPSFQMQTNIFRQRSLQAIRKAQLAVLFIHTMTARSVLPGSTVQRQPLHRYLQKMVQITKLQAVRILPMQQNRNLFHSRQREKASETYKSNLYCCRSWCSGSPDRSCCDLVYDPEKAGRRTDACSS